MGDFASQFVQGWSIGKQHQERKRQLDMQAEEHDLRVKAHKIALDQAKFDQQLHERQLAQHEASIPQVPQALPDVEQPLGQIGTAAQGLQGRSPLPFQGSNRPTTIEGANQPIDIPALPMPGTGITLPAQSLTPPTPSEFNRQQQATKQALDTVTFNDPVSGRQVTLPKEGIAAYMTGRLRHPTAVHVEAVNDQGHKIVTFVNPDTQRQVGEPIDVGPAHEPGRLAEFARQFRRENPGQEATLKDYQEYRAQTAGGINAARAGVRHVSGVLEKLRRETEYNKAFESLRGKIRAGVIGGQKAKEIIENYLGEQGGKLAAAGVNTSRLRSELAKEFGGR
jgi:hypothetical protein